MIDNYEEGTVDLYNEITEETVNVRCTYLKGAEEVVNYTPPDLIKGWVVVEGTYKPLPIESYFDDDGVRRIGVRRYSS